MLVPCWFVISSFVCRVMLVQNTVAHTVIIKQRKSFLFLSVDTLT